MTVANNRYQWLLANDRRKVNRTDRLSVIVTIIDELAMFSTVLGTKPQQEEFASLLRGLVSLGRACGMPVIAATQHPSWDIIPASLRDLFGFRAAFRCTSLNSSNIILGQGLGRAGLQRRRHQPHRPGRRLPARRGRLPAPDQGRVPDRRRHLLHRRLRRLAAPPAHRHRLGDGRLAPELHRSTGPHQPPSTAGPADLHHQPLHNGRTWLP
jgi:hypothetical protein